MCVTIKIMTVYHGGKQRIGKEIAQVIHEISIEMEEDGEMDIVGYCEPFVGMAGVYQHIPELFKDHKPKLKYKAGDANKSVIMMWKAAQKGWVPPKTCTKEKFERLRYNGKNTAEKGFIGHACSFGGQYFQGYVAKKTTQTNSNNVKRIGKLLKSVVFTAGSYERYSNLRGYIIYCDPPYSSFSQYYDDNRQRIKFDEKKFWKWCQNMAQNNFVFISEYKSPKGATVVWSKSRRVGHNTGNRSPRLTREKLLFI